MRYPAPEHFGEEGEEDGGEDDAGGAAHAAEDHHHHDLDAAHEVEAGGAEEDLVMGVEPAADAGEEGADGRRR
jgi:hypothetical protein